MATTFSVFAYDEYHSEPIAFEDIPLLLTIIQNIRTLLTNDPTIRHSYLCVYRQTVLDASPATAQEDEVLQTYFLRRWPEVRLMNMLPDMYACIHRQSAPRRLYLNRQLAVSLRGYDSTASAYSHNSIMLTVATIFHELAHLLWSDLHSPKVGTPPHFVFPTTRYFASGQLMEPPQWGESGFVVEGRLFHGILLPVYEPGFEGNFMRIASLEMRRDLGGLYNEAGFRIRTSPSGYCFEHTLLFILYFL